MNKNLQPDYTDVIIKIFTLTANIRKLRRGFSFSQTDSRAKMDKRFIQKWTKIKNKQVGE